MEKILIVDDEMVIRDVLSKKLTSSGYHCSTAKDAFEALVKIRDESYSIVLCDIMMPGMNGIELLKQISSINPKVAVIMVTAMGEVELAVESMKLGAYDYLAKPFNLDRVVISVDRALERRNILAENTEYKATLERKVKERTEQLETRNKKFKQLFLNSIKSLIFALEAKDKYTRGRSEKVSQVAALIARQLSLSREETESVKVAALLHDIGMVGIKEDIMNKTDDLTDEELEHIKSHTEVGAAILQPIKELSDIIRCTRHHHERYDGSGYPDGLKGREIPLAARIINVADTYVALTSPRAYREAMTLTSALGQMERMKGDELDPEIADAFLNLFKVEFQSDLGRKGQELNKMMRNISIV